MCQAMYTVKTGSNPVLTTKLNNMKTINDFIQELQQVSEDKRKLPLIINCPNGLEVEPTIKMKFENHGSPMLGDKLESMVISWRD